MAEEDMTYIYGLVDPRDGEIHYVGKSNDPDIRRKQHIQEALREEDDPTNKRKEWIVELEELGLEVEVQVLAEVPFSQYGYYEGAIMEDLRAAGAELYNIAPAGAGGGVPGDTWGHNPERRAWLSQFNTERWKTPEFREHFAEKARQYWAKEENKRKMSELQQRIWADNEEGKRKISEAQLKNWHDPEYREAVTQSNVRAWSVPERLAEHSERTTEMWKDPAYRERTLEGRNAPDVIEKHAASMREHWAQPGEREAQSKRMTEMWADPEHHESHAAANRAAGPQISASLKQYHEENPEASDYLSEVQTERMKDPARRDHLSNVAKSLWDDPEYREKQLRSRNRGKLRSDVEWAAEQLGVKKVTVYKYCNQGRLGRKVDGSWVIGEEDVEAFREGER